MSFDALPASSNSISVATPIEPSEKRRRWFELFLILFLAFSSSVIRAAAIFKYRPSSVGEVSGSRWIINAFHEIGILMLLGYILWRGGRSFRDIGFRWSFKDASLGLPLFAVAFVWYFLAAITIGLLHVAIYGNHAPHISARDIFGHMPLSALPLMFINPFYEELVVRAYLMTEIRELSGSMTTAAVVSLILQTSYHIYYGWFGALSLGFAFLSFVGCFAIWRRALPLVVAHAIFDFIGYFRLH